MITKITNAADLLNATRRATELTKQLTDLLTSVQEAEVMEEDYAPEQRGAWSDLEDAIEDLVDHDLVG